MARKFLTMVMVLACSLALAQSGAQNGAAGTWEGAIEIPGSPLGVSVTLEQTGDAWSGTIDIPAQEAMGLALEAVAVDGANATFRIAGVPGEPTFTGEVAGDTLSGTFAQGGQEFPFTLTRHDATSASAAGASQGDAAGAGETATQPQAEDLFVDPAGRFSLPVPTGWTVSEEDGFVRVAGPEGGLHVDVVIAESADPETAVADAWALTTPDFELEPAQTLEPPSDPSIDRTMVMNYDSGDGDEVFQALAQVVGERTYVLLVFGELEMVQRRSAQLQIVASGFEITGVEQVDLKGAERTSVADVLAEFEEFVTTTMEAYGIPGASIAVVEDGEVAYLGGFGVTEAGGDEPMTPTTQMMIGSTGKTMTSMLIASLVDDGVIEWDTPVVDVLPQFAVADEELSDEITIRNLLCACTGVPRKDLELLFNYDELSAEAVVESLRDFEFYTDFGEAFQYSNQLVATAGYAAAAATGAAYGELSDGYRLALSERVLEPIGMPATTLDFDEVLAGDNYALPHQFELATGEYETIGLELERLLVPVEPAGSHWSTAEDMARYLVTELNRGVTPDGERVVSEENLLVTWEPQVPISATESYGLGWMVGEYKGLDWIYHSGNTLGFTSEFVFLPGADLGVVALANAQGANAFTGAVAVRLLELVYDLPPAVVSQSEFQVEQMDIQLEEQREQLLDRVPLTEAVDYFGTYTNPALGDVSLRIEGGQLLLDAGEWSTQVRPILDRQGEPDGYVTYGAPLTGLTMRFETGDDGGVSMIIGEGLASYAFERLR